MLLGGQPRRSQVTDRNQRVRHRPQRDTIPWDALQGYDVAAAELDAGETKDEPARLFRKRRRRKALTTEEQRNRKRQKHQRCVHTLEAVLTAPALKGIENSWALKLFVSRTENYNASEHHRVCGLKPCSAEGEPACWTLLEGAPMPRTSGGMPTWLSPTNSWNRSRAKLARQRATLAEQEDNDLKANFPVQPSLRQQLDSVAAFREAVSQRLLLCGCCTRELFPDEGIKSYQWRSKAVEHAKELLMNPYANFPATSKLFPGLLLDDDAVDEKQRTITLCDECHRALARNRLPPLSLANCLWLGPACGPDEFDLQDMHLPEELLCCPNIGKMCLMTLLEVAGPGTGHRALKGHTIVFPQDTLAITQKLPRVHLPLGISVQAGLHEFQLLQAVQKILCIQT